MKDKTRVNHRIRLSCFACILLFVMAGIYIMSSYNGEDSADLSSHLLDYYLVRYIMDHLPLLTSRVETSIRKYAHILEYLCLGISSYLFFYELFWKRQQRSFETVALSVLLCFLYSCLDEWHQTFVADRAGRFSDVLFDSTGFLLGIILLLLITLFKKKRIDL